MPNRRLSQFAVPVAVVGIIVMMIVPLPPVVLDVLITVNIAAALSILLAAMYVRRPLDFAVFPALLLVATLFRLGLNISVTRQVLVNGYAGGVVEAFGHFVIGGSLVVGLVIFMILIVIQFIVVTKGAERVAEVGARFTLDAMPGKQMAIDADLNAGLIDDDEARRRRADVAAEADFYGAMDGGSKFVKGDAIAAIIITVINLVGGMAIGILQKGMSPADAVSTYSLLTVGDGLVSQIPALMLSVATGLIVTRATTEGDMGSDVVTQFAGQKRALQIAGAGIMALALMPGLPKVPFVAVGGLLVFISTRLQHAVDVRHERQALEAAEAAAASGPAPDSAEALLAEMRVDPVELELAYDMVDLVDASNGGDLLGRVKALRRKMALELGVVLPPVRTRDDLELPLSTYRIRLHGVELGRGEAPPGHVLVIGDGLAGLPGTDTREPVFGLPARWVPGAYQHQAELSGHTVVDRSSVVITHLAEIVRQNAGALLSREDVRTLVEALRSSHPSVVEELTPTLLTLGEIQRVLQGLLDERVPIRDLGRIFEALSARGRAAGGQTTDQLVEAARAVLGPAICASLATGGALHALTFDPLLEQDLLQSLRPAEGGDVIAADGSTLGAVLRELARLVEQAEQAGLSPVLVCSGPLRAPLHRLIHGELPRLAVLSYAELGGPIDVHTQGVVSLVHAHAS
ncbi:MAG: flagellar biosynthesis protein FlhA [Candidatus Nanopelagicales bacterium]